MAQDRKGAEKGGTFKSYKTPVKSSSTVKQITNITPTMGTTNLNKTQVSSDFPVFVNTGNMTKDNENYQVAKKAWIANNPEKYEQMKNQTNLKTNKK
jgi:hypothetical protein